MTLLRTILLFFIMCSYLIFAQHYFPTRPGDSFQLYLLAYSSGGPGGSGNWYGYGKFWVSQDTILDGKKFHSLPSYGAWNFLPDDILFYYDTINQVVWAKLPGDDTLKLAVDFNVPADSSFTSYITGYPRLYSSEGISADTIFGEIVQSYKMIYQISIEGSEFSFSDKFGISSYKHFWIDGVHYYSSEGDILSAIIDTLIYNPLYLTITYLDPLDDRPIDTFPFVIHGFFDASIPSLVDSFYVDILQTRTDSLITSWRIEFVNNQVNVPITSVMLHIGDVLKIRATATDESIFNNVIHYPDTGYALIHVLPPVTNVENNKQIYNYSLNQNYPNPFNPFTIISYEIAENQKIELEIFDVLGNKVAILVDEEKSPGRYEIEFDGSLLSSGVYFYKLIAGDFTQTRKMILSK